MLKIKLFFIFCFLPFCLIAHTVPSSIKNPLGKPAKSQHEQKKDQTNTHKELKSPAINPSVIKKVKDAVRTQAKDSVQKKSIKALTSSLPSASSLVSLIPNFHDFDQYQKNYSKEELEKKITSYLQKHPQIEDHYRLSKTALCIYKSLEDKKKNRPEYRLRLAFQSSRANNSSLSPFSEKADLSSSCSSQPVSTPFHPSLDQLNPIQVPQSSQVPIVQPKIELLPLKGKKIAIDPGHFGGIWASLEQRKFCHDNIYFDEGTLTFLTAKKIKTLLEKLGADVLLTRTSVGQGALNLSFYEWKAENPSNLPDKLYFHQVYNRLDLLTRAEKINQFHPDLTLILHFNAHLESSDPTSTLTPYNYHLAFVGGSFRKNELDDPISRYEFLRLLLTEDLEKSIYLASLVLKNLEKTTQVSSFQESLLIQEKDFPIYLKSVCVKIDTGLYSRNLALTRLVHSPICYGEVFCQNNLSEAKKLNLKNSLYSSRLDSVAQAYSDAIVQFFNEENSTKESFIQVKK
jgi:N-acetylmuramoyl-L-alanine amidase